MSERAGRQMLPIGPVGGKIVSLWEYRKIALNQLSAKTNDVDVLNDAGDEGWELVAILPYVAPSLLCSR